MNATAYSLFSTVWGTGVVYASDQGIIRVDLPDFAVCRSAAPGHAADLPHSVVSEKAAALLQHYFCGECVCFNELPVDLSGLPRFRLSILQSIRQIGYGDVWSYGRVAAVCGSPEAARAVGGALAANPIPIIIPCHRVVASDGRLTGFSAAGGVATKRILLEMEGVEFTGVSVAAFRLVMHR